MKNKPRLLSALLINNRPFEPGAGHAVAIVFLEWGGGAVTGSWGRHADGGMVQRATPRMSAAPGTVGAWGGRVGFGPPGPGRNPELPRSR